MEIFVIKTDFFFFFQAYIIDSGKLRLYRVGLEELDKPVTSYEIVLRHNIFGTEGFQFLYYFKSHII